MRPELLTKKITLPFLLLILILLIFITTSAGSVKIPLYQVLSVLSGKSEGIEPYIKTIILDVRLPRIIMAILVGMMLSSSGVVVQSVFQNPIADPYIIGISASATFGAVLAFIMNLPDIFYGIFAFIVSVITTFLIFEISRRGKGSGMVTLLIVGVAFSAFLGAFISFSIYVIGEDSFKIIMWTMGYLGDATWTRVGLMLAPLLLAVAFFYYHRSDLDAFMMGEEEAHALGLNVPRLKKQLLIVSCLIVAFSVAFTGLIGFVGLIIPHAMRLLVGYSNTKLITAATLAGAVFLLLSDTAARLLLAPTEIPIGVVTAFFGAPFFLFLALKSRKGMMI